MIEEIEALTHLKPPCNRRGMDTLFHGYLAAFAIDASKKRKIKQKFAYGSVDDKGHLQRGRESPKRSSSTFVRFL